MNSNDLNSDNLNSPVNVYSVQFVGLEFTNHKILQENVDKIMNSCTLEQLLNNTTDTSIKLHKLGIIKDIQIQLDKLPQGTLVTLVLTENKRIRAVANTELYDNNICMTFNTRLFNTLGSAESFQSNISYGISQDSASFNSPSFIYSFIFNKPLNANPDTLFEISCFNQLRSLQLYHGYDEKIHGFNIKYKVSKLFTHSKLLNSFGDHEFSYDLSIRQNLNIPSSTPWSIRQDAGHSMKSSISHLWCLNKRNDDLLPTNGFFLSLLQELAGLGGDVQHYKAEIQAQYHIPFDSINLSSTLKTGVILPFNETNKTRINDRFYLGGPLSLRGFQHHGIGPKDSNLILGGNIYWAIGTSLLFPLPYISDNVIKGHLFANAGSLVDSFKSKILMDPSVSIGIGMIVRFSALRFELNACCPVRTHATDTIKTGLQFGIGILWQAHGQLELENAKVCVLTASPLSSEILKNLVLPGIGSFTIVDCKQVSEADLGSNFFLSQESIGFSRAQSMISFLLELNEEVKGNFVNRDPESLIEQDPGFFNQFSIVIATNLSEKSALTLSQICWNISTPLILASIYGFFGYLRISTPEHTIVETHPEKVYDLRLDVPWQELIEYSQSLDFNNMDSMTHSHVPNSIILLKCLLEFKQSHGHAPLTSNDKSEFKAQLIKLKNLKNTESENFDEAISSAYRAWTATITSPEVLNIIQDEKAKQVHPKMTNFWILVYALREFVENEGNSNVPVSGIVPDMKADTESFVKLLTIYRQKARADFKCVKIRVHRLLQELGKPIDFIPEAEIEMFCKNARSLCLLRYRSLVSEYDTPKTQLLNCKLGDLNDNIVYYILKRAVDRFYSIMHRYPGSEKEEFDSDIANLKKQLNVILTEMGISTANVCDDYIHEIVRAGASEMANIAGIMGGIVSQEVIKLVTRQYVPINNTLIFDGIKSVVSVYEL